MNGIYFTANDVALDWMIAAIESIRARGCTLPATIIAFDERTRHLEMLAAKYKWQIWHHESLKELDRLGTLYYPHDPINARMFRRLASFWGPYDNFIYTDADIVALMNWDEILQAYSASNSRFWYFGRSPDDVYKPGPLLDELRRNNRGVCFNGGFFASSRGVLTYERVAQLLPEALKLRSQFADASGEQPFFNYYMDHELIPVESASTHLPDLYDWNWAPSLFMGRSDFYLEADREGAFEGKRFPMIHWAGFDICSYMPNRELFLKYRLRSAPPSDQLRYAWEWQIRPLFGNLYRALKRGRSTQPLEVR